MALGIVLAVLSTLQLLDPKKEQHFALAQKYSQNTAPRIVDAGNHKDVSIEE